MPTADRPSAFVPFAIRYFLRQDYENRELIILDDGSDPVSDLIPNDPRIRYIRMQERRTMGTKHNQGCILARGEIIAHWDDDDWFAERRLSYQVSELLKQPRMTLTGFSRVLFYSPNADRAWEFLLPACTASLGLRQHVLLQKRVLGASPVSGHERRCGHCLRLGAKRRCARPGAFGQPLRCGNGPSAQHKPEKN